jgi:hypothetical protein
MDPRRNVKTAEQVAHDESHGCGGDCKSEVVAGTNERVA